MPTLTCRKVVSSMSLTSSDVAWGTVFWTVSVPPMPPVEPVEPTSTNAGPSLTRVVGTKVFAMSTLAAPGPGLIVRSLMEVW
jgi:hypothetical protein